MDPALIVTSPDNVAQDESTLPTMGRFESIGVLGHGGMGIVLRARDPQLNRDVALKVLHPGKWRGTASTIGEARLQREAQAMAKLAHPNVVTVYEMGKNGDDDFIAMELVEGGTLRGWLRESPRTWSSIIAMFIGCGKGLACAHDAELVHRDFKPENVLVDKTERPRVSDFGLVAAGTTTGFENESLSGSAAMSSELRIKGAVVGTPAYMSPEQWTGKDVDARSDQFSFCVALWESLYGEHPFSGEDRNLLRSNVLAGNISHPKKRQAGYSRDKAANARSCTAAWTER